MKTYPEVLDAFYQAFDFFNDRFCSGELPKPIIIIHSRGRKNAYGWFWKGKWRHSDGETPELNISAECLDRTVSELFSTLLHEMAHLYNDLKGVQDTRPPTNTYHNKHFRDTAQNIFKLAVTKDLVRGFAFTSLTPDSQRAIDECIVALKLPEKFDLLRVEHKGRYKRYFFINCERDDKEWVKEKCEEHDCNERQFFAILRKRFESEQV